MIKVILAEDHHILREGLQCLLKEEPGIQIVGEASNGRELIALLHSIPADVILMDINMPVMNGIEATRQISQQFNTLKVLGFSMMNSPIHLQQMLDAGAVGYVVKSAGKKELVHAIREVAKGNTFISPAIAVKMERDPLEAGKRKGIRFSNREIQILELIAEGLTNKEIAEKIFLSKRTVETHRKNLIDKTNSKNSFALIKYAIINGIIKNVNLDDESNRK